MSQPTTPAGSPLGGPGPAPYLIGSADADLLTEVLARFTARRVNPDLLVAELTDDQVQMLRREFGERAVIEPDAPLSPFSP